MLVTPGLKLPPVYSTRTYVLALIGSLFTFPFV